MMVALASIRVAPDRQANETRILALAAEAASAGAALVLFPEAATTGLINVDIPAQDYTLAQPIPNPFLDRLGELAVESEIHIGIGFFELDVAEIYDSFALFSDRGDLVLHYRRISPGWHGPEADPIVYRQGSMIQTYELAKLGRVSVLLCGDLFCDELVSEVRRQRVDLLLVPFARAFEDGSHDQERWDREELPYYAAQVQKTETKALLVNYIGSPEVDDGSFGGAWVISESGEVLAAHPVGVEGVLLYNLQP